jgi:polysaccharide export outer membrane protein
MRLRRLLAFVCVALALGACARQPSRYAMARSELDMRMYGAPQPAAYAVRRATPVFMQPVMPQVLPVAVGFEEGPYTLDSGDKLRVVVFGQDPLSNNYTVDAQGQISLPLIGNVEARGMTTAQLGNAIAARLRQSFIRDPSVAVEVEIYRPFFVLGEVTYPGQYPFVPNMTVENAIAIAGGFTPRASRGIVTITRKMRGVPARTALPLRAPLRPGDTIEVGERWF